MKIYTVKVEESADGNLYIPLPDELLEHTGWTEDDTVLWTDNNDGTFTIGKANDSSTEA
jgi:hypothetical protein